jgi:DNA end-binding protein Ku
MQAIWKGTISFGLVSIPVSLVSAVRKDELKFHLLRKSDLSPIRYKRVAEADGEEVTKEEIVKGYEYEKEHFVVMDDEDFKRPAVDGVQTIQIIDFVALKEIDPLYFDKPYYLEPQKGSAKAFALLRDAMLESGTVGIAKVVIRSKQHLAALKPKEKILLLELMHFEEEIVDPDSIVAPSEAEIGKAEKEMAKALIGAMKTKWDPGKYTDDYKSALLEVIEGKIKQGAKGGKKKLAQPKLPRNVVNMVEILQKSLDETARTSKSKSKGRKHTAAA